MNYNILIGGAAGQGMDTLASLLEKILKRNGFYTFTVKDYMSRIRGGHNFIQLRFGDSTITSHASSLDCIIALNNETITLHEERLLENGFVVCDEEITNGNEKTLKLPLKNTAKNVGNIKTFGSCALGVVIKQMGIPCIGFESVFEEMFGQGDVLNQNINAFQKGLELTEKKQSISSPGNDVGIIVNGNQAIALGALAAGCNFYSAYPMTPSTSIMDYLASKMKDGVIVVEQAEDEIAAINMAVGASNAGARAMTGTSGGGFCLKVEALGLAGMMEVPLVVANIQRPGPVTGFPTRTEQGDLKFVISASHGDFPRMVIAPTDPENAFKQTVRAFNLADKYQIPVIILGDQFLADTTISVPKFNLEDISYERYIEEKIENPAEYNRYKLTSDGISPRVIPGKIPGLVFTVDSDEHDESGHITEDGDIRVSMMDKRLIKLDHLEDELIEPAFYGDKELDTLLIAWGSVAGSLKEAVDTLNKIGVEKFGALLFSDVWPLPLKKLHKYVPNAKRIINVEQNATGQFASILMEAAGVHCDSSILKYDGRQISAEEIVDAILHPHIFE